MYLNYWLYNQNFALVEDIDNMIDIDDINDRIDLYLRETGLIPQETQKLRRVVRDDKIVTFNGYALLDAVQMLQYLPKETVLIENAFLTEKYKHCKIPIFNSITSEMMQGPALHALSIDKNIKLFVDALNKIRGTKSFASCDGHGQKFMYVSFYARNIKKTLSIIDNALHVSRDRFSLKACIINYHVNLKTWKEAFGQELYYEIRVHYNPGEYNEVCKFINDSALEIEKQCRRKLWK